ncbi:hypothetical protein Holit_03204 [Hollandina sp. SP2]
MIVTDGGGPLYFRIWGSQSGRRERIHGRDRREQLSITAPDQASVSQDLLLFEETVQPLESF